MTEDKLEKFWTLLAQTNEPIPLEDACKKAGLTWYNEDGIEGCDELEIWIGKMKRYQSKKFIKKIMRNKKFQQEFILSPDFLHLYLLKTKAKHPALKQLYGRDSTFSLLNWTEMYALRRKQEPIGFKNPKV
jgi:hypothetical protein